jgi:hypothetical protein
LGYIDTIDLKFVVFSKKLFNVSTGFRLPVAKKTMKTSEIPSKVASNCVAQSNEIVQQTVHHPSSRVDGSLRSATSKDFESEEPLVRFVKCLIVENILTIDTTNVKRGVFKEIMVKQRCDLSHDEVSV